MKIPHDIIVLRQFVYSVGDRDWTEADRDHVRDLVSVIWRRCTGKKLPRRKDF